MSSAFYELANRLNRQPLWLEFERYAAAVFAGQPADWATDAHRYADCLSQAQRLVRSDVVAIAVLDGWLADPAWRSIAEVSLGEALSQWNEQGLHQRFATDVLDALFHRMSQPMLVMSLPAPSQVLRRVGRLPPFDFGDLDDVAAALTAVLRSHSTRAFGALALRCDAPEGLTEDEREACQPLLKSARYYGWGTALRLDAVPEGGALSAQGFDAVLLGHWSEEALDACGVEQAAGGLAGSYWREPARALRRCALRYGEIPPDAVPEKVLEHLQVLHGLRP